MIEFILYTLLFVYLGVSTIFFIMLTVSLVILGGWQAMADESNAMAKGAGRPKPMSSNRVQWGFVNLVVFWPVVFAIAFAKKTI